MAAEAKYDSTNHLIKILDSKDIHCPCMGIDSNNTVTASMDLIFRKYDIDEICYDALKIIVSICDECYPELVKYSK